MLFPTLDFLLFFVVVLATDGADARGCMKLRKLAAGRGQLFLLRAVELALLPAARRQFAADLCRRDRDRRAQPCSARASWIVGVTVALHLLLLSTFKYLDFLVGSANHLLHAFGADHELPFMEIILPVGISFFTFHGISYLVDVYRGDVAVCRRPLDILLYLSFFPQLVAGPIVRASFFLPQLARPPRERGADRRTGAADPGRAVQEGGDRDLSGDRPGRSGVLRSVALSAAPICCSRPMAMRCRSIAISPPIPTWRSGWPALLGYRFPINFNQPYRAQSLREFWQRWHISLSSGCATISTSRSAAAAADGWFTARNLMITMLLGGIWHGAAWKFVVWGALHGARAGGRAAG